MATKTTSQKHAALKRLGAQTQRNIFEMLRLTHEILEDQEYVDKFGGEGQLIDQIEEHEFSHFGGQPSLHAMLRAYRANPLRKTWQDYHFNLRVMIDLATPERERGESVRINWKARAAELEEEVKSLEVTVADYKAMVGDLRNQVDKLTVANGELNGQVKLLTRRETAGV